MNHADYFPIITAHAAALADAARGADASASVPSCPEWDVAKLVRHTGTAHRWSSGVVRTGEPLSPKSIDLAIPEDAAGLPDWLEQSAAELVATLSATDPDAPCWTWTAEQRAGFWSRRMAHETAVHRWDGQGVLGVPEPFEGELAVDGIDEHLENLPFIVGADQVSGTGESLHLHCTDRDGEWLVVRTGTGLEVTREHAKGDVALKGPASDLLLIVLGRRPAGGWFQFSPLGETPLTKEVEVFGDQASLESWQEILHF